MSTNNYVVYKHTSNTSGKSYIGITNDMDIRTAQHKAPSNKCLAFARAIAKYGWTDFVTTFLHTSLSTEEANILEADCIISHNTLAPYGYNLKAGGNVKMLSEQTKQKISATKKGHVHSEETKNRISSTMKGRKRSEAASAKPRPRHTELHKQRIRESRLGQKRPIIVATCPHCNKSGNNAAMHRHHFDNCKHNPNNFAPVLGLEPS